MLDWNNKQNGALIGFIGVVSAFIQGGYSRRATVKVGEGVMARRGVFSCAVGLILLAILPQLVAKNTAAAVRLLQGAAVCLAFTSATVVNSLTSYASLQCDEGLDKETGKPIAEHPQLAKGKALGHFRSSGQLGRAIGPLLGTSAGCKRLFLYLSDTHFQPARHIGHLARLPHMPLAQLPCYSCHSA